MEIIIGAVLALAGILFGFWAFATAKKERNAHLLAKTELEQKRAQLTSDRKSSGSSKKKTEKKESKKVAEKPKASEKSTQQSDEIRAIKEELSSNKDELKSLKQKNYDLAQQLEEAQKGLESATRDSAAPSQELLFDLRQELAEAKAEVANLRANKGGSKKAAASKDEDSAAELQAAVDSKKTLISTPVSAAPRDAAADAQSSDAQAELAALKASSAEQLRAAKNDLQRLEKETQNKLKKAVRTADQHRRRAENNDKAYKITQRQLDVARERIEYLESLVKKASFASATEQAEVAAVPEVTPLEQEIADEEAERVSQIEAAEQ